jgi:hypothetical protein
MLCSFIGTHVHIFGTIQKKYVVSVNCLNLHNLTFTCPRLGIYMDVDERFTFMQSVDKFQISFTLKESRTIYMFNIALYLILKLVQRWYEDDTTLVLIPIKEGIGTRFRSPI